ncbi:minor capsid protein [Clostridium isatidis]|uniref:minor capsid protein n=1 Tax=Clostridium isatidis TaxID=182773 RepID=UPI003AAFFCDE
MRIKVNVKLDNLKIKALEQANLKALEMTTEAVLSDIKTSAVVPKDTGELERSGFVDLKDIRNAVARIVFDTPYARRLYWHPEYNFRTDKNPNAQGKWMEAYLTGDKRKFVIDTYSVLLKQLSKGLIN